MQKRRSERKPARVQLVASGQDKSGVKFTSGAQTVNLSHEGGCLACDRELVKGDDLELGVPNQPTFLVKVRWCRYDSIDKCYYVGVELDEPSGEWLILVRQSTAALLPGRLLPLTTV